MGLIKYVKLTFVSLPYPKKLSLGVIEGKVLRAISWISVVLKEDNVIKAFLGP